MSSNDRRLQRFFQYIHLRSDRSALLAVQRLGLRIPVLWTVLDKAGTSNGAERIALIGRYLALFGASPIKTPLGDRDFIGADRIECLLKNDIPFALRVKETMTVERDNGQKLSLKASFCKRRIGATLKNRHSRPTTLDEALGLPLRFAAKRIENRELPILATTFEPQRALEVCKKRWAIERFFGDVETRGFKLEDTRPSNPAKLDTLLVLLALAVAWDAKTADILGSKKHRKTKSHGYLATSYFRIGFDRLRNRIRHRPRADAALWKPLRSRSRRVVSCGMRSSAMFYAVI